MALLLPPIAIGRVGRVANSGGVDSGTRVDAMVSGAASRERLKLRVMPLLPQAASAKAEVIGVKQTICICDDGGNVLALHRLPGGRLTGVDISIAKAFTEARVRHA